MNLNSRVLLGWSFGLLACLGYRDGDAQERLVEVLPLLETQRIAGIQKLQQVFSNSRNESEKFDSALLLSSLPTDTLGTETQSVFLEYLNSHPNINKQNPETLIRFYRKLGDVRYDLGKLNEARESYLKLKKLNSPTDVEYAHYRLGWIYVNEKNPVGALDQWMTLFEGISANQKRSVLGSLVFRDLGRVWPEVVASGVSRFDSKIAELTLEPEARSEFLFGLKLGIRYVSSRSSQDLEKFRKNVRQGLLSVVVLEGVAASEKLVLAGPCSLLDWFPVGLASQSLESDLVFETLLRCYRLAEGAKNRVSLAAALETLALRGRARLPLAEIYFDQNRYSESCSQYSEASKEEPGLSGIVGSVARACEKSVLATKNSKLTLAQRQTDLRRIYDSFLSQAPKPLTGPNSGQWLEILEILLSSEAKNLIPETTPQLRYQILKSYLPSSRIISDSKAEKRRLWIWTEFLAKEVDEVDPTGASFSNDLDTLKWSQVSDAYGLAALALKRNRIDWIWARRNEFRLALKEQPGFAPLLEEVSGQALRKSLGEGGDYNLTGPEIESVLALVNRLEAGALVESLRKDFLSLPADIIATDWGKDFKQIESLAQRSSRILAVNLNPVAENFVGSLTGLVKKSQNLTHIVSDGPWYHKRMAAVATGVVKSHQKLAATKIRKVTPPKVLREPEKQAFIQEMNKIAAELDALGESVESIGRRPQSESQTVLKPRVIDLGQENTESSVRQPGLKVIESDSTLLKFLPQIYKSQFENLESELTRPEIKSDGEIK